MFKRRKPATSSKSSSDPVFPERASIVLEPNDHASVAWSRSGAQLAILADGVIHIWSLKRRRIIAQYNHFPALNGNVLAWSPALDLLATSSRDKLCIVDSQNGRLRHLLSEHNDVVQSVAWSPSGDLVVSGAADRTVKVWNWRQNSVLQVFNFPASIQRIVWSDDDTHAFCACGNGIYVVEIGTPRTGEFSAWHKGAVLDLSICHSLGLLASGAENDPTVRIWDYRRSTPKLTLEGHTGSVIATAFSSDGQLLATKSVDGKVLVWSTDTWDLLVTFVQPSRNWRLGLAFHPRESLLASVGGDNRTISIFDFGERRPVAVPSRETTLQFCNAKVMLVGDTGVGKTALGVVLSGESYRPTDSTHKRNVALLERENFVLPTGEIEEREILLWDLAGQPGYRLVNQLHLTQAALALVVFDARSEVDPMAGVKHWIRALRQAERVTDRTTAIPKLLVAGRADRGGLAIGEPRVAELRREGFVTYIETSAKEGWGIAQLSEAIRNNLDWTDLPRVRSTAFLHEIQQFIITEKNRARRLSTAEDLYRLFLHLNPKLQDTQDLRDQFRGAVGCLEARDLIRRFSFGDLLLLEPELLDSYASAMIMAAKDEPDGMGYIAEDVALSGAFRMPRSERLENPESERLLLIATVEDLLKHDLMLREPSDGGTFLVFPSQFTREHSDLQRGEAKAAVYRFAGSALNVYSTLVVRLSHGGLFMRQSLWRNAALFDSPGGGWCGIRLQELEEGVGELQLFFSEEASAESRLHFESYVRVHLERRTPADKIIVWRPLVCESCGETLTERQIEARRSRGYSHVVCPVCGTNLELPSVIPLEVTSPTAVARMDDAADNVRRREIAASVLQGKKETGTYDVFLCHNNRDKEDVKRIAERLMEEGVHPWLDEKDLRPGAPWIREVSGQIERISAAAVFVGASGLGPWQDAEIEAILTEFLRRDARIIPVLLRDAAREPQLPLFLRGRTWVDFRKEEPDPFHQLLWGITGTRAG